jgi:hypothetical protein
MNTDRLIDMLRSDIEPVRRGHLAGTLVAAISVGAVATFILMLATVGPRAGFQSTDHLKWIALKLVFALSVVAAGAPPLYRSIRPGLENEVRWSLVVVPLLVAIAVSIAIVLDAPRALTVMLRGATTISWMRCLSRVVFFAALPWGALIYAIRQGAPTRLRLSGAFAGLVAGGMGAAAYAFNCTSDSIPFVAVWYGLAIVLCTVIGAQLGPRMLRW